MKACMTSRESVPSYGEIPFDDGGIYSRLLTQKHVHPVQNLGDALAARRLLARRVATWRNREFLAWCWQNVGLRHRPTLALLRQVREQM